jgi:hypothetical protein
MSIQAVRVQDSWDFISSHIDKIMSDLPWKDFRKEDLYASCAGGTAAIFIDTDFPLGESFFIAETAGRVHEIIADMAANSGCNAVEFITGSPEVMEHGKEHGFDKVMYRCRREVEPRAPQVEE